MVVVGSGAGALQVCHELDMQGIGYAAISADPSPGGMFRQLPLYQRLLSITKPYAAEDRHARPYEWYDWNSLLSDDPNLSALMPGIMDGSSSFPSREEMETQPGDLRRAGAHPAPLRHPLAVHPTGR